MTVFTTIRIVKLKKQIYVVLGYQRFKTIEFINVG